MGYVTHGCKKNGSSGIGVDTSQKQNFEKEDKKRISCFVHIREKIGERGHQKFFLQLSKFMSERIAA